MYAEGRLTAEITQVAMDKGDNSLGLVTNMHNEQNSHIVNALLILCSYITQFLKESVH